MYLLGSVLTGVYPLRLCPFSSEIPLAGGFFAGAGLAVAGTENKKEPGLRTGFFYRNAAD